jgi:hypothetical protein
MGFESFYSDPKYLSGLGRGSVGSLSVDGKVVDTKEMK